VKHPVRLRLAAQQSLERIAVGIAEHDLEAALRFADSVEAKGSDGISQRGASARRSQRNSAAKMTVR
jgi:plasmid stabilization system protein ParE